MWVRQSWAGFSAPCPLCPLEISVLLGVGDLVSSSEQVDLTVFLPLIFLHVIVGTLGCALLVTSTPPEWSPAR